MNRLLRGIDNLGKNAEGEIGLDDTRQIIDGLIRASQFEGVELDAGKLFDFARRGKIAAPALSTEFIATTAAAMMEDMTAEGFGTALSSACQFLGDRIECHRLESQPRGTAAHRDPARRRQRRTGSTRRYSVKNPDEWVQKHLIPALQKDGVDTSDDVATAQAVAKLARNTLATGMLARMIQQREQIDRLVRQEPHSKLMALLPRNRRAQETPSSPGEGFKSSLENLSGAMGGMPHIVSGLNSLTDVINGVQQAIRDGDPTVSKAATIGGVAQAVARRVCPSEKRDRRINHRRHEPDTAAANLNPAARALGGSNKLGGIGTGGNAKRGPAGGMWTGLAALPGIIMNNVEFLLPRRGRDEEERRRQGRCLGEAGDGSRTPPDGRRCPIGSTNGSERLLSW